MLMSGKRGLVMGVANDHSIAWGIAKALAAHGASLAFTYQGDALGRRVPFDGPAGYYLTTTLSMSHKAIQAQWACEDLNEREWREDNLRPKVARWKADVQARHDAEQAQREQELREYEFAH